MTPPRATSRAAVSPRLALAALLLAPAAAHPRDETVTLDLASASASRRLPFDVPFLLEGEAPPGAARVEMRLRVAKRGDALAGAPRAPAAVSGTDAAGRFRLQVPALPADREVEFEIAIERSLTESGRRLFRQDVEALLRSEMAPGRAGADGGDVRLREGIRVAFARALAEGRTAGTPPGERSLTAAHPLFDVGAPPEQAAQELARLSRELRAARGGLEAAIRRHHEALPSLAAALAEVQESDALAALVAGLEARPELDPRNPRSPLALSDEARALATGDTPAFPQIEGGGPAEVAAAREAHRRTARALRELRDWTQAVVAPGGPWRSHVDDLQGAGALSAAQVRALAGLERGRALRRAESWAFVLEDYTADAERALSAGDRALATMLSDLDAEAAGVVVRERLTARGSTAAGLYASLDLGLLYGFEVDGGAAYAALSVSLAPVNKGAPLRGASLRKRLSLILGLTLTDMRQEDDQRFENLIGERWNVVAGMGLRVTGSLRVGAGALLLLKNDPNPLVTERTLGAVPYLAASLDVDVGRLFGGGQR
jgi:hypothetical protein